MSMDEQYAQMQHFQQELIAFNEALRASLAELQIEHDRVSPLWQDEMRRHYDSLWGSFHHTIKHYSTVEGPSYVEFIAIKLHTLRRYLYGD